MRKICVLALTVLMLLIVGCTSQKNIEESISAVTTVTENTPSWQEQFDLGIRFLNEENYKEAIIAFEAAIKIDPKKPDAYIGRGNAYVLSGETEDNLNNAFADYEKAIELDDTLEEAYLGLADIYIRQGDYDKAIEILNKGLEKTDGNQEITDKIAEIEGGNIKDSQGKTRRTSNYDRDGNLVWYHEYTYNSDGKSSSVTSFDKNGNQTGHVDYEYDESGRSITTSYCMSVTGEVGKIKYERNTEGKILTETNYSLDDEMTNYIEYVYKNDLKVKDIYYDNNSSMTGYSTYEYNALGQNIKRKDYHFSGTLLSYIILEYNDMDHCAGYKYYDGYSNLLFYTVYIYDENGNYIGSDEYDADGNLTSSTRNE